GRHVAGSTVRRRVSRTARRAVGKPGGSGSVAEPSSAVCPVVGRGLVSSWDPGRESAHVALGGHLAWPPAVVSW
ncbi:hypothetical protein ACFQ08_23450, partial [Streptosporangium algeriense]